MLGRSFFNRRTDVVATELLGKYLIVRHAAQTTVHMITEAEAYDGFRDRASHAHRGETKRNAIMFGPPGRWYVYFTYGMHWMLNIVTREAGYPAAVLLRGAEGYPGPARLTKALGIDVRLNGKPAVRSSGLWIEDRGVRVSSRNIKKAPRVGVAYAGPYWAKRRWRFTLVGIRPSAP